MPTSAERRIDPIIQKRGQHFEQILKIGGSNERSNPAEQQAVPSTAKSRYNATSCLRPVWKEMRMRIKVMFFNETNKAWNDNQKKT